MLRNEPRFDMEVTAESPALVRRRRQILGSAHADEADLLHEPSLTGDDVEEDPDIPPMPSTAPPPGSNGPAPITREHRNLSFAGRRSRILVASALAIVVGAGWWAYRAADGGGPADVPLIAAASGPEKFRPDNEGGLVIENQNIGVYGQIDGKAEEGQSEVLLPEPEAPMAVPTTAAPESEPLLTAPGIEGSQESVPLAPAPDVTEADGGAVASTQPAAGAAPAESATIEQQPAEPTQAAALTDGFRVQLAAVKSGEAANAAWTKLTKTHSEALNGLLLKVVRVDLGAAGIFYRVQAGPLEDRSAAEGVCSQLKLQSQPCLVVAP